MVYKLVEVDGIPVEKRSSHKGSHGGHKLAQRLAKTTGTIVEEVVYPAHQPPPTPPDLVARPLTVPLVRDGEAIAEPGLKSARERVSQGLHSLPWDGLKLSNGDPAIPTRIIAPTRSER
jgi:nicotinate phosphoribosyltransferase